MSGHEFLACFGCFAIGIICRGCARTIASYYASSRLHFTETPRGFARAEFTDRDGIRCSIQKSSLATEDCIWLGCNKANPRTCVAGKGWTAVSMPEDYVADTRMHLTRQNVAELLPALHRFVDRGGL
jgi:hypothetical protein